jgi:hypothetical protein
MNEGDGLILIARECPEHGRDVGPPGMVEVILGKCWYCKRELVDVQYVPAEQLQRAVETLERIRDHANSGDDAALLAQHELDRLRAP